METDIFSEFKKKLSEYLQSIDELKFNSTAIKISNCSLKGDFSIFSNLKLNNDTLENLKEASKKWSLPIHQISLQNNTILISLDRNVAFSTCIKTVLSSSKFGSSQRFAGKKIVFIHEKDDLSEDFTSKRIQLLSEVAKNLSLFVGFEVFDHDCDGFIKKLYFTHKSNFIKNNDHDRTVLCGVVQDFQTKVKVSTVTVSEYKIMKNKLIIMEMKERDKVLENVTDLLTDAVLKFNLLHVKINSPVVINFNSPSLEGSDGAAIFILYNYSRLNAILHEFEDRVSKRYYPPLPPIDSIDFSSLREEKEWCIIFNYVLRFPSIIVSCVENIEMGKFLPHLLCNFLHDMARVLSSYYRSTRVLLLNRPQILPLIFARIYFIKSVHQVFNNGLKLLSIQPSPAV